MTGRVAALTGLLQALRVQNYNFIAPTPATHTRVLARRVGTSAVNLRDIFGWSLPIELNSPIPESILTALHDAGMLDEHEGLLHSRVRVSSLEDNLFVHSSFPTTQEDSVFFGPDSYRFARFLHQTLPYLPPRARFADIGAGTGVGAVIAARLTQASAILTDINPVALDFARANWAHAGLAEAEFIACDALAGVTGEIDLIIANPPYIADPAHRAYRDGGGMHGGALSVRWAGDAARRLESGGVFVLYTGAAIVNGDDPLKDALFETLHDFEVLYGELDPDVFGEELERADYADVERIAVVGVVAIKK